MGKIKQQEKLLRKYTALVEEEARRYFEVARPRYAYHPFMSKAFDEIEEYVLRRGMRLASCSTLLTYEGYAGEVDGRILGVGVGVELYRHSILAHDDLVDGDEFRRGGKALHALRNGRFGTGFAVFAGDMMYALTLERVSESDFEVRKRQMVSELLAREYAEVNESQLLDLYFEGVKPSVAEWYAMASKRAASLFKATMLSGAILAGAPRRDFAILEKAAEEIGYSFDIQDDIIGTFASEEQYGRPIGGDIALAKKPLHVVLALEALGDRALKALDSGDHDVVRSMVKESGALAKAKESSRAHAARAKEFLDATKLSAEAKESLKGLIDFVAESLDWYK